MTRSIKKLELSFTYLEFFDSIVISTIKEDVLIDEKHVDELREICMNHFRE